MGTFWDGPGLVLIVIGFIVFLFIMKNSFSAGIERMDRQEITDEYKSNISRMNNEFISKLAEHYGFAKDTRFEEFSEKVVNRKTDAVLIINWIESIFNIEIYDIKIIIGKNLDEIAYRINLQMTTYVRLGATYVE